MRKWVITALELGNSNLKLLLGFKLAICKLSNHMKWGFKAYWVLVENHNLSLRSKVWGKIPKDWRQMVEKLDFSSLQITEVVKIVSILWGFSFRGLKFGLSIPRAQELYKFSLHTLGDLWKVETRDFHS
jgi:hypothetical protein